MTHLLMVAMSLTLLGPGALAPANPGVLETVSERRVNYGYGLTELVPPGVIMLAVEDCDLLGYEGLAVIEDCGVYKAQVVDCQQVEHQALSDLGIVADVNQPDLGHRQAV